MRAYQKAPLKPKGPPFTGIDLAVTRAVGQGEDRVARRGGDLVREGVEQVIRTDREGVLLGEGVAGVEVHSELRTELLARIVRLGAPAAVVVTRCIDGEGVTLPVGRQVQAMVRRKILSVHDLIGPIAAGSNLVTLFSLKL